MRKAVTEWNVYRTRFLIRARQLTTTLAFVDALGREHKGAAGDYLVESSDGTRRIAPREIFEDIYVAMDSVSEQSCPQFIPKQSHEVSRRRASPAREFLA